jgi:hypothetical protein
MLPVRAGSMCATRLRGGCDTGRTAFVPPLSARVQHGRETFQFRPTGRWVAQSQFKFSAARPTCSAAGRTSDVTCECAPIRACPGCFPPRPLWRSCNEPVGERPINGLHPGPTSAAGSHLNNRLTNQLGRSMRIPFQRQSRGPASLHDSCGRMLSASDPGRASASDVASGIHLRAEPVEEALCRWRAREKSRENRSSP